MCSPMNSDDGLVEFYTQNRQCSFQIRAVPLPQTVTHILEENTALIALIEQAQTRHDKKGDVHLNDQTLDQIQQLRERLKQAFIDAGGHFWNGNTIDEIWSFGPHKCGPNLLLNRIPNSIYHQRGASIWTIQSRHSTQTDPGAFVNRDEYCQSIINGFQLATSKGSLCEEPLMGVGFIIERWTMNTVLHDDTNNETQDTSDVVDPLLTTHLVDELESLVETMSMTSDESSTLNAQQKPRRIIEASKLVIKRGPLSGQIVSTIRESCRKAFDSQPRRLVAAMYKCELIVNAEALGK
jgi:ribosome assembly protein 1